MLTTALLILWINLNHFSARAQVCDPVVTLSANQNNICAGATVVFHATVANEGTSSVYQWTRNDRQVSGASSSDFAAADFHDGEQIRCMYRCHTSCGTDTTVASNLVTIHVLNEVVPVVTISNSDSLLCEGEPAFFTAEAFYGNEIPTYQWEVNGVPVGGNEPFYRTDSLDNGSTVKCTLTVSTPSCPGSLSAISQLTTYVYPMIHPTVKITPRSVHICRGETVTLAATANGGTTPRLEWEVNGRAAGDFGPVFVSSTLVDGDTVSCTVTIDQDSRCHTSTSAPSNKVVVHVKDFTDPTITITAPALDICSGTFLSFTAQEQYSGAYKSYQWRVNGQNMPGGSADFGYDKFKDGDRVDCMFITSIPGCSISETVPSNVEVLKVRQSPQVSVDPAQITVVSGETAQLHASIAGNTASYTWSPKNALATPNSLTPATLPMLYDTTFTLLVTDTNGCTVKGTVTIKVLRRLYMPSAFTPNGDGNNDIFRIPPGASVELQDFSVFDRWGNVLFKTSDVSRGWDGTYRGKESPAGIYIYLIRGVINHKKVIIKESVTLLR